MKTRLTWIAIWLWVIMLQSCSIESDTHRIAIALETIAAKK